MPERGTHEWDVVADILDACFMAFVGFCVEGQPFVIPTLYGRDGETLYLHGSAASRMMKELATGVPACVTVALADGLVLARSAFHHSMNYRSVAAFGTARKLEDEGAKRAALKVISEHVIAGRWEHVRPPSGQELKATTVLSFPIDEVSAKSRSGPPSDDEDDYELPVWAGVLPLTVHCSAPKPDARVRPEAAVPAYLEGYASRFQSKRE